MLNAGPADGWYAGNRVYTCRPAFIIRRIISVFPRLSAEDVRRAMGAPGRNPYARITGFIGRDWVDDVKRLYWAVGLSDVRRNAEQAGLRCQLVYLYDPKIALWRIREFLMIRDEGRRVAVDGCLLCGGDLFFWGMRSRYPDDLRYLTPNFLFATELHRPRNEICYHCDGRVRRASSYHGISREGALTHLIGLQLKKGENYGIDASSDRPS